MELEVLELPIRGDVEPADLLMRQPFSTTQLAALAGLSKVHPAKSLPLNNVIGSAHLTLAGDWSAGARRPVQVHRLSLGPWAEPLKLGPTSLPSNTRSVRLSSSSLGDTNSIRSPWIWTLGSGRALPHRPTNLAFQTPCSRVNSSQEGSGLRLASWIVRSQRPAQASAGAAPA